MRVFSSNCLYWDEDSENWINKGCKASVQQCILVVINAAVVDVDDDDDDDDIVDDADADDGIVVVVAVAFVFVCHLVFVRQDKRYVI